MHYPTHMHTNLYMYIYIMPTDRQTNSQADRRTGRQTGKCLCKPPSLSQSGLELRVEGADALDIEDLAPQPVDAACGSCGISLKAFWVLCFGVQGLGFRVWGDLSLAARHRQDHGLGKYLTAHEPLSSDFSVFFGGAGGSLKWGPCDGHHLEMYSNAKP